jgi:5-formyltetrahydrofolate cyclo-ligase
MKNKSKSELRKYFLNKRLSAEINSDKIINNLKKSLNNIKYQSIGIYHPIKNEVDILKLMPLLDSSIQIALPVIINNEIDFYSWDKSENSLIKNPEFKILEPQIAKSKPIQPDIIITPLLSYDKNNIRLGYGGGFYDRYFARYPSIVKIGVASKIQESKDLLPCESFDIKLDQIITD